MSKVQTRAGGRGGGKVGVFPPGLSLDLVGIAGAASHVTPAGEKFCEILRRLSGNSSRITGVKSEDRTPILSP